jgi:hypothetical protein
MQTYLYRLVGILLLSTNAFAEPTETIQGLMKLRLSIFDFGLYRLSTNLDAVTTYNADSNRITILADLGAVSYAKPQEVDDGCKEKIAGIKIKLGVSPRDGKAIFKNSSFAKAYFMPPSMAGSRVMTDSTAVEIDNIIEIGCIGLVSSGGGATGEYQCKSMLRSTDVLCGQL